MFNKLINIKILLMIFLIKIVVFLIFIYIYNLVSCVLLSQNSY